MMASRKVARAPSGTRLHSEWDHLLLVIMDDSLAISSVQGYTLSHVAIIGGYSLIDATDSR
jgi:hypothetical protein